MRLLGIALAIALALVSAAHAQAPLDRVRVEAYVDGAVRTAMRTDRIAGVSVAVVDRSGVVLARGYGTAALSPRRPVDADTLFRVGSISKTAVWIAVMQQVEQGRIGLDDPINDHLPPELRIPDDGFRQPIRVRHLMTHAPGFEASVLQDFFLHDPARLVPMETYLRTHRVRRVREPAVLAVYSNYGAVLTAAMVVHESGQAWPDYAEQHVFRPLGMAAATYREPYGAAVAKARGLAAPMPPAVAARVSQGFAFRSGRFAPQPFEYIGNVAPAGALSASAKEMALYMRALLDPVLMERAGVLRADTALAMREPMFANAPGLGAWRHGFVDYTARRGRPCFGHGGDTTFQHSTMEIYPDAGLAIFVSVNTSSGTPLLAALPNGLLETFVGPPAAAPARAADAEAEAARVAGTYRALGIASARTERAVTRLVGSMNVVALPGGDIRIGSGPGAARLAPIGGGVFVRTDGPGRMAFRKVDGRMRLLDDISSGGADRVGYFEGPAWLMLITGLAAVVAVWGTATGARRLFRSREPGRAASLALDGLCLLWLVAGGLFFAAVAPWLADIGATKFSYPGRLFPLACWTLLAAAAATPIAGLLAIGPLRPKAWGWWRWARQAAALGIFAGLGVTLFAWGFLGYSGW